MRCAEDYVRFCCRWVLDHCEADLAFITKMYDKGAKERLEQVRPDEQRSLIEGGCKRGVSEGFARRECPFGSGWLVLGWSVKLSGRCQVVVQGAAGAGVYRIP
jgi:hypothetical protein